MSDYKLAIKIAGELDSSLSGAVKEAQGYLDELNGGKGGGAGEKILSGFAAGAKELGKASLASLKLIGAGTLKVGEYANEVGQTYEVAMSQLAATMSVDKMDAGYQQLEGTILELGKTTNFSATEAAEAANVLAMAGYDAADNMSALPTVLHLAGAGALDMESAASYLTSTMASMNVDKTEQNFAHIADVWAKVSTLAKTDVAGLGEAFSTMGASGAELSGGVEEMAALAGVLGNVGYEGAEAGTHIRNIVGSLQEARNADAAARFEELGIQAYDASGKMRPVMDIMQDMNTAMQGWTDEARTAAVNDVFKLTDRAAAKALLDAGDSYDNLYDAAIHASDGIGAVSEMYQTQTDNLQGDLDIMKSAAEGFGIDIYKSIVGDGEGGLRGAVQEVTGIIDELHTAFSGEGLSGLAEAIGTEVGNIADKIDTDGAAAIEKAASFASDLISAIGSEENSTSIGSAASTIISSLATSFLDYTGDFAVAAGNIFQGIITALGEEDVGAKIGEAASGMVTKIGTWFQENKDSFGPAAGNLISSLVSGIASNSGEILTGGIAIVEGLAEGVVQAGFILISHAPQIVYDLAMGVLEGIDSLFDAGLALGAALLDGIMNIGESIKQWWSDMWDLSQLDLAPDVSGYFVEHTEEINAAVRDLASSNSSWQDLSDTSKAYFEQLANGSITLQQAETDLANYSEAVGMSFEDASGNMQTFMSGAELETALYTYKTLVSEASEAAIAANQEAAESTQETSAEMAQGISAETQALVDSIKESGDGVTDTASSMASEFETLKNEFSSSASEMQEAVNLNLADSMGTEAMGTLVDSAATGQISELSAQINEAMQSIQTSVASAALAVSASFAGMAVAVGVSNAGILLSCGVTAAGITAAFSSIDLSSIASNMMAGLTNGITAGGAAAIAAAQSVASQIASIMASTVKVSSPSRVTYEIGDYIGQGLEEGINASAPGVYDASEALANTAISGPAGTLTNPLQAFNTLAGAPAPSAQETSGGIVFSPQITIAGNASESDVRNALAWSMSEFERMYDRLMKDRRRTSFA